MLNVAHACVTEDVNGPGRRFTVWVQGCSRDCAGCFNPGLQPFAERRGITPADLAVEALSHLPLDGVSLSGGEPFDQAAGLGAFLQALRLQPAASAATAIAFTGYTLEELRQGPPPWRELLAQLDLLVDGPFLVEQSSDVFPLRGSANQRLVPLTPAGAGLAARAEAEPGRQLSVIIAPEGELILTGFPPPGFVRKLHRFLSGEAMPVPSPSRRQ